MAQFGPVHYYGIRETFEAVKANLGFNNIGLTFSVGFIENACDFKSPY